MTPAHAWLLLGCFVSAGILLALGIDALDGRIRALRAARDANRALLDELGRATRALERLQREGRG